MTKRTPSTEGYTPREPRRMPGLEGKVLEAANLSRQRTNERWAREAAEEANREPRRVSAHALLKRMRATPEQVPLDTYEDY